MNRADMNRKDAMRTALFVAVTVVFVSGCSGRLAPPHPPSPPPSHSSPTTSVPRTGPLTTGAGVLPGEKPPVEPAIAKTKTDVGAMAFAMYYEDALDWSFATSDSYLLKQVSAPSCDACNRYIRSLDNLQRGKGHVIGGRIHVDRVSIVEGHHLVRADAVVEVRLSQSPMTVVVPSSSPSVVSRSVERPTSYIHLLWLGNGWSVNGDFGP